MATFEILAAFALSIGFMLVLWSLKDLLLRPRRTEKPLKLALLIEAEKGGDMHEEQCASPCCAEGPDSVKTENKIQDIRSDEYDGGNG